VRFLLIRSIASTTTTAATTTTMIITKVVVESPPPPPVVSGTDELMRLRLMVIEIGPLSVPLSVPLAWACAPTNSPSPESYERLAVPEPWSVSPDMLVLPPPETSSVQVLASPAPVLTVFCDTVGVIVKPLR